MSGPSSLSATRAEPQLDGGQTNAGRLAAIVDSRMNDD